MSDSDFSSDSEDRALDEKLASEPKKEKRATPEKRQETAPEEPTPPPPAKEPTPPPPAKEPTPPPAKEPTPPPAREPTPPPAREPTPPPAKEPTPPPARDPTPPPEEPAPEPVNEEPIARPKPLIKQDTGDSDFSDSESDEPAPKSAPKELTPPPKEPTPPPKEPTPPPRDPTPEPVKEESEEEEEEAAKEPTPEPELKEPTPEPQPEPSSEEELEEEEAAKEEVAKEASPEPQPEDEEEEESEVKTDDEEDDEVSEPAATRDSVDVVAAPVDVRKASAEEKKSSRRASVNAHDDYRMKFKAEEEERKRKAVETKNVKALGIGMNAFESKSNLFMKEQRKMQIEAKQLQSRGASDYSYLLEGNGMSKLKKLEKERHMKKKAEQDKLKGEIKYKHETADQRTEDVAKKVKKIKKKSWKPKVEGYIYPGNNMEMKKSHKFRDSDGLFAALDKLPSTTNLNDQEAEWTKNKKHDNLCPTILLFQNKKRYKEFLGEVSKKNMRLAAGQMAIARHAGGIVKFTDMYAVSEQVQSGIEELKKKFDSDSRMPVENFKDGNNEEEFHCAVVERGKATTFNATEEDEYELWMQMLTKMCPKESVVFVSQNIDAEEQEG